MRRVRRSNRLGRTAGDNSPRVIHSLFVDDVDGCTWRYLCLEKGVRMLADTKAEFVKSLGLGLDLTDALGGVRSKRFSIVVDNGRLKQTNSGLIHHTPSRFLQRLT